MNEVTSYTYDSNNNLIKVTDANNKVIEYTYDALNNELTEKDSLGKIESREYYSNGLVKKKVTRNKDVIDYIYDDYKETTIDPKLNETSYQYDKVENRISKISEDTHLGPYIFAFEYSK